MKKSRFSDAQIIVILKQAESDSLFPELCREHGISFAIVCKWLQIRWHRCLSHGSPQS
jgi:putative transposase